MLLIISVFLQMEILYIKILETSILFRHLKKQYPPLTRAMK